MPKKVFLGPTDPLRFGLLFMSSQAYSKKGESKPPVDIPPMCVTDKLWGGVQFLSERGEGGGTPYMNR